MRDQLAKELEKIGLSENEAKVYLAGLELGPSTAQMIAAKATVSRPTTYIMIETLIKRGLMSSFQKGKKRIFVCGEPSQLKKIIEQEKNFLSKKVGDLEKLLPQLLQVTKLTEPPIVTVFEGAVGLRNIHDDLIETSKKTGIIDNIAAIDDARKRDPEDEMMPLWNEIAENKIKVRTIYIKSGEDVVYPGQAEGYWQTRRLPEEKFNFGGEISVYGNKVAALTTKGKIFGLVIESREIADTFRTIFELAWQSAGK